MAVAAEGMPQLYRRILRAARVIDHPNFRYFFIRKAREDFRGDLAVTDLANFQADQMQKMEQLQRIGPLFKSYPSEILSKR